MQCKLKAICVVLRMRYVTMEIEYEQWCMMNYAGVGTITELLNIVFQTVRTFPIFTFVRPLFTSKWYMKLPKIKSVIFISAINGCYNLQILDNYKGAKKDKKVNNNIQTQSNIKCNGKCQCVGYFSAKYLHESRVFRRIACILSVITRDRQFILRPRSRFHSRARHAASQTLRVDLTRVIEQRVRQQGKNAHFN